MRDRRECEHHFVARPLRVVGLALAQRQIRSLPLAFASGILLVLFASGFILLLFAPYILLLFVLGVGLLLFAFGLLCQNLLSFCLDFILLAFVLFVVVFAANVLRGRVYMRLMSKSQFKMKSRVHYRYRKKRDTLRIKHISRMRAVIKCQFVRQMNTLLRKKKTHISAHRNQPSDFMLARLLGYLQRSFATLCVDKYHTKKHYSLLHIL
jgi:hypothetical protein